MGSKPKLQMRLLVGAVSIACLLIAAGCGSESTTEANPSPIDEYLGTDIFSDIDPETAQLDFMAQQRQADEAIATCMKEQGFEYNPEASAITSIAFDEVDGLEYGSKEWTAKYGFGITTQAFSQTQVGPELVGYNDTTLSAAQEYVDPNQEYLDTLDQATEDAFYLALYGDDALEEVGEPMAEEDFEEPAEPSGCRAEAYSESLSDQAFYDEFGAELDQLYSTVEDDSRIAARVQEVSSCVTKAGYELYAGWPDGFSEDGVGPYSAELEEIRQLIGESGDEDPFEDLDFDTMSEEQIDAMFADLGSGPKFTPEAKTKLAELQNREIDAALAAYECGGSQTEIWDLYRDVFREYEQRFVETNKDKLDAFKVDAVVAE